MTIQERIRLVTAKAIAEAEDFTWDWITEHEFIDEMLGKADIVLKAQSSKSVVIETIMSSLTFAHKEHAYYGPLIEEK